MPAGKRIGIVIPSSNVVIEPLVARSFWKSDNTVHFSRLGVVNIELDGGSLAQFEMVEQLSAAKKLSDARVDAIVWGGTSSSWLGIERDEEYCSLIEKETGISTTTCVLEMNRIMASEQVKTFGLVTPYTPDVQHKIIENYKELGFSCVSEQHYGGAISNDYASITANQTEEMVRVVAEKGPDIILIMCTNMRAAGVAASLETETGIPIMDSATIALQAGIRLASED